MRAPRTRLAALTLPALLAAIGSGPGTRGFVRRRLPTLLALLASGVLPASAGAQEARCASAHRFFTERLGLTAVVTRDTIEDWRTDRTLAGCRVTAAGLTRQSLDDEAARFYERVRAAGWSRTPDPRDAPSEASLRFRMGDTDCLFNLYAGIIVGTAAEIEVNTAVVPGPGETRYNVLVQCIPAMEAASGR